MHYHIAIINHGEASVYHQDGGGCSEGADLLVSTEVFPGPSSGDRASGFPVFVIKVEEFALSRSTVYMHVFAFLHVSSCISA